MPGGRTATPSDSEAKDFPVDLYSFAPIAAVLDGAYTVVTTLASWLAPLAGEAAAAVAIVLLTLAVRALLIPVGRSLVRAEFTRARLAPHLQELQRRYKKNPELLQRKTMELYAEEKASPFAGCLPVLAQAPVLSAVYGLFILGTIAGHPNLLLAHELGGVPLGTSLIALVGGGAPWPGVLVFAALLGIIATTAWLSRRVALRFAASQRQPDAVPADGVAGALQNLGGALSWAPFVTVVFAAFVPLAATIYLSTTTAWTLAERVILRRVMASR
jgi:YidC/Oxa1 family membrane protein insertase